MDVVSLYTVDQATKTLPYVRRIVAEVRECYGALRELGEEHNRLDEDSDERAAVKLRIRDKAARLRECEEELLQIGVILKDYEHGLIDFPAELDGRPILLCWEDGEGAVAFWHETEDGYKGRQPVPADCPAWPATAASAARG